MNNIDLNQIQIFVEVAKLNSFSMAAEKLGIEKSTASVKVKQLEQTLGVTLFYRTTRRVSLTEAGQSYFIQCQQALGILDEANNYLAAMGDEPQGNLKVGSPYNLTDVLLNSMLPEYLNNFPKVSVQIIESNRLEDLSDGKYDVLIRSKKSDIPDSSLIYRKLFDTNWIIVADLNKLGVNAPSSITELLSLPYVGCLNEGTNSTELHHKFVTVSGVNYPLQPRFSVNNMKSAVKAAVQGLGFVITPRGPVAECLNDGTLAQLLPELQLPKTSMYVVYPSRSGQPAKVSSFIDALFDWRDSFIKS